MGGIKRFWAWMFQAPAIPRSDWAVVGWWELRRIPYNLIVGSVGVVSLIIFFVCVATSDDLGPGEDAIEPLAILFAPIMMNVGYCAGWFVENILRWNTPDEAGVFGPLLLKLGLGFSLLVVTAPAICCSAHHLLRLCGIIE